MRRVVLRLEAVGQGLAYDLFVMPLPLVRPAVGPPPGFALRTPEGPGSDPQVVPAPIELMPAPREDPPAEGKSAPMLLRWLVTMPASKRCGRCGPLRFRVRPSWRTRVKSLRITARGRRIVGNARTTITIATPRRRTLHVALRVRMRDGRERSGTRLYTGCRS